MNIELAEMLRNYLMNEPGIFMDSFNHNKKLLLELARSITAMNVDYAEICEVNCRNPSFELYVEAPELEEGTIIRIFLHKVEKETEVKS